MCLRYALIPRFLPTRISFSHNVGNKNTQLEKGRITREWWKINVTETPTARPFLDVSELFSGMEGRITCAWPNQEDDLDDDLRIPAVTVSVFGGAPQRLCVIFFSMHHAFTAASLACLNNLTSIFTSCCILPHVQSYLQHLTSFQTSCCILPRVQSYL